MKDGTHRLLLTGASGQLGRRAAELVLGMRAARELVLVTRTPQALADFAARGVAVRYGDFSVPASLSAAFAGCRRMLIVSTGDVERRTEQHRNAIDAAAQAGVEHAIYTSGLSPEPPNPAVVAPSHYATEQALAQSGMTWTVLRNSLYADFQAPEAARAIETGTLVHNRGDGRVAYVAREDCAAVAAAVLAGEGHEGAVYDVTGSQTYDARELAALYGELGRRPVATVPVDDEDFVAGLIGDAAGDDHLRYGAKLVASFGQAIRGGYVKSCARTVADLTGRAPRTLRDVLTGIAAAAR